MPNVKLNYRYCDYANYKNNNEAIFTNPDNLSLEQIETALRAQLIDGLWFYASRWGLKDLHFDTYNDQLDHAFHEFIEVTDEAPAEAESISGLLKKVM